MTLSNNLLRLGIAFCSIFYSALSLSAQVNYLEYKGQKQWYTLTGQPIKVTYAETSVNDDSLSIIYDAAAEQWYLEFKYIGNKKLTHSKSKRPEFFVRTIENKNSGRYDSDHVMNNNAKVFYNDPGKPQYVIIPIDKNDLRYLKVNLDIGAGYYLSSCVEVIKGECLDLGEWTTYLFPGKNASQVITAIEKKHNLSVSKVVSLKARKDELRQKKENDKIRNILKWYQGDWAQVTPEGPLFNGCNINRTIDFDSYPNLMQKGSFLGSRFKGVLAISALGKTEPDHLYFSSGYTGIQNSKSLILDLSAETKKVPLFLEQGGSHFRLRLGSEIPGIPYKRIIDTDGKSIRLSAWDTGGKKVEPLYFLPCK